MSYREELAAARAALAAARGGYQAAQATKRAATEEYETLAAAFEATPAGPERHQLRLELREARLAMRHSTAAAAVEEERFLQLREDTQNARGRFREYKDYRKRAQLRVPWLPRRLVNLYANLWVEYGDSDDAIGALRQSAEYETYFPGNRRENGSLRMSEIDYLGTVAGYQDTLAGFGINNKWLKSRIPELIEGGVSVNEFGARVAAMDDRILAQGDELRKIYSQYFGLDGMSDKALLAAAIDPTIRAGLLNRQITIAEIGGEALESGFRLGEQMSTRLFQAGIDRTRADELFTQADLMLGGITGAARRQHEGRFGINQFLAAEGLGDASATRQLRRTLTGEASRFTEQGFGEIDEFGRDMSLIRR